MNLLFKVFLEKFWPSFHSNNGVADTDNTIVGYFNL